MARRRSLRSLLYRHFGNERDPTLVKVSPGLSGVDPDVLDPALLHRSRQVKGCEAARSRGGRPGRGLGAIHRFVTPGQCNEFFRSSRGGEVLERGGEAFTFEEVNPGPDESSPP